jgi:hypothetical protein
MIKTFVIGELRKGRTDQLFYIAKFSGSKLLLNERFQFRFVDLDCHNDDGFADISKLLGEGQCVNPIEIREARRGWRKGRVFRKRTSATTLLVFDGDQEQSTGGNGGAGANAATGLQPRVDAGFGDVSFTGFEEHTHDIADHVL